MPLVIFLTGLGWEQVTQTDRLTMRKTRTLSSFTRIPLRREPSFYLCDGVEAKPRSDVKPGFLEIGDPLHPTSQRGERLGHTRLARGR